MSNIEEKLIQLAETKSNIKDAIISKGVEVDPSTPFRDYADKIQSIVSGGADVTINSEPLKQLNAYNAGATFDNLSYLLSSINSTKYVEISKEHGLDITGSYDFFIDYSSGTYSNSHFWFDLFDRGDDGNLIRGIRLTSYGSYPIISIRSDTYSNLSNKTMTLAKLNNNPKFKFSVNIDNNSMSVYIMGESGVYELVDSFTPSVDIPVALNFIRFGLPVNNTKESYNISSFQADSVRVEQNGEIIYELLVD